MRSERSRHSTLRFPAARIAPAESFATQPRLDNPAQLYNDAKNVESFVRLAAISLAGRQHGRTATIAEQIESAVEDIQTALRAVCGDDCHSIADIEMSNE